MGNKVSRPARKLTESVDAAYEPLANVSRKKVQLPTAELKARKERGFRRQEEAAIRTNKINGASNNNNNTTMQSAEQKIRVGKDGRDPQANQAYIDLISDLGRQIHSKNALTEQPQANVTALKQLLNRKKLHLAGQKEAEAHRDANCRKRTMINPKTLTAIIDVMNDSHSTNSEVAREFQLQESFLSSLKRYKVAHNVVIIEEHARDDEIGPIKGKKPRRQPSKDDSQSDWPTIFSDDERIKELKKRLE